LAKASITIFVIRWLKPTAIAEMKPISHENLDSLALDENRLKPFSLIRVASLSIDCRRF
jgi:hypothetical protein